MKGDKLKLQEIQKEQYQLVKIEQILQNLLGNVNESINELKVEELQLRSSLIELLKSNVSDDYDHPTTSAQAITRGQTSSFDVAPSTFNNAETDSKLDEEGIENINKQMLALESILMPLKQKNFNDEEEEDDDDDDDDDEDDDMKDKNYEIVFIDDNEETEDDDD